MISKKICEKCCREAIKGLDQEAIEETIAIINKRWDTENKLICVKLCMLENKQTTVSVQGIPNECEYKLQHALSMTEGNNNRITEDEIRGPKKKIKPDSKESAYIIVNEHDRCLNFGVNSITLYSHYRFATFFNHFHGKNKLVELKDNHPEFKKAKLKKIRMVLSAT